MRPHRALLPLAALLASGCADQTTLPTEFRDVLRAQYAKSGAQDTPVSSELLGGGSAANLNIQSDQQGAYTNSASVSSILQASLGDWVLDLQAKRVTRTVNIDLTDALPGNPSPAPFASALVKPRFIAKASLLNAGGFTGMSGLGSTILSPISIGGFAYGGKSYGIRMNPDSHPGTNWTRVTCTGVAADNSCNRWRMTPTGNYDGVSKNVGYLEQVDPSVAFVGLYYFTFDITITK